MPQPQTTLRAIQTTPSRFELTATLYGPIRPSPEIDRRPQRALKSAQGDDEFFTEITLLNTRRAGLMEVQFSVTASSPAGAQRAGTVYLGQLCDVLSSITREPVRFLLPHEDARQERSRDATHIDRILSDEEWSWIIGTLVNLRQKHPRYLASSSWYRKGLCGIDPLEVVCCYWRVIERLSLSYCEKQRLPKDSEGRPISNTMSCVRQFIADRGLEASGGLLGEEKRLQKVYKLRNDVSHGNEPITPDWIENAGELIQPLEDAAFACLSAVRAEINHRAITQ